MPKYNVEVQLTGTDGNVFMVVANVCKALKKAGIDTTEVDSFRDNCFKQHSYEDVLSYIMDTVEVC